MRSSTVVVWLACRAAVALALVQPVTRQHSSLVARRSDAIPRATTGELRELGLLKRLLGAVAAAAVVALLPLRASAAGDCRTKPGALCAALAGAQSIVDANSSGRWVGGTPAPSRVEAPK